MIKINDNERKVLQALSDFADESEEGACLYTRSIAERAGLEEKQARRSIRALVRKGLAEYHRGLFNDDGMVAGSGYCISFIGHITLRPCDFEGCTRRVVFDYKIDAKGLSEHEVDFDEKTGVPILECADHYKQSPKHMRQTTLVP